MSNFGFNLLHRYPGTLICYTLLVLWGGCWGPTYQGFKALETAAVNSDAELQTVKSAIRFLELGHPDSFRLAFAPVALTNVNDSTYAATVGEAARIVTTAERLPDSLIRFVHRVYRVSDRDQIATTVTVPYRTDSVTSYITLVVSEGRLYGLNVSDAPFGTSIAEPKHSEPHLERQALRQEAITWFRIWYGSGFDRNDYGDRYGYYAVSGDRIKLGKLGIAPALQQLFSLISATPADSIDFQYLREETVGDPEYIYLRFRFDNKPYDRFGEFTVYYHLKDEPGHVDPMSRYIIVKHSDKTRYLILASDHPEIVAVLTKIAYGRYDRYFERRWM